MEVLILEFSVLSPSLILFAYYRVCKSVCAVVRYVQIELIPVRRMHFLFFSFLSDPDAVCCTSWGRYAWLLRRDTRMHGAWYVIRKYTYIIYIRDTLNLVLYLIAKLDAWYVIAWYTRYDLGCLRQYRFYVTRDTVFLMPDTWNVIRDTWCVILDRLMRQHQRRW